MPRGIASPKITEVHPDLAALTTYAVAGAGGLFVQREISGDAVDLVAPRTGVTEAWVG